MHSNNMRRAKAEDLFAEYVLPPYLGPLAAMID